MTDTNIACPKCGAEIALTVAVSHRLREDFEAKFERQRAHLSKPSSRGQTSFVTC